ncbi:2-oxoacid:acceptor oxidoreductase family protein [Acetivibrio straminisolvens]|uniref:Pyruvate:ferredoxin oxidoreductase n=1 Tax=Acetivibrio straminisolvens JCM 21531 TaxID=1294263 RepID=W4V1U9_9FIRM|nr:2-oxoacid:acceptor oxidoreductase family protein [Acetivibrio straminisolvens]GAE86788.1 pyruvate:ferredoxin oxidoreductase [Acetivibrio straminisolvens JCM 21531]
MIEIRWHGRGGQGGFTASKLLGASVVLYGGKHALSFPSFGPERRGAPVLAFTKIDSKKICDRSEIRKCDFIVVLDETLFSENFFDDLKYNGKIIINSANQETYAKYDSGKITVVDASSIALKVLGKPITNTAMLGALVAVSDIIDLNAVLKGMEGFLKGELLAKNIEVVERTFLQCKEVAS